MSKPTYSIDAPDQQRLKTARIEIESILRKHDIAGACILHTPGMSEWFYDIRPTYSVCSIDESIGYVRVKSKLDRDHGGNRAEQLHDQAATANMIACLADNMRAGAGMFIEARKIVDEMLRAEHQDRGFVPDPRQVNPS